MAQRSGSSRAALPAPSFGRGGQVAGDVDGVAWAELKGEPAGGAGRRAASPPPGSASPQPSAASPQPRVASPQPSAKWELDGAADRGPGGCQLRLGCGRQPGRRRWRRRPSSCRVWGSCGPSSTWTGGFSRKAPLAPPPPPPPPPSGGRTVPGAGARRRGGAAALCTSSWRGC